MLKVSCREDYLNTKGMLLFNSSVRKLYLIKDSTTSTVHVFEYPVLVDLMISNDVVFAGIGHLQGYLKWSENHMNKIQKLPMRCGEQAQYLMPKSSFDFDKYLKWEQTEGKFPTFVEFVDTAYEMYYDIEQTWLNRNILSLVASYRLLNKPDADVAYYEKYVEEYASLLNCEKWLYMLKNIPDIVYPFVDEHMCEIKHLLKLDNTTKDDENLSKEPC